MLFHIIVSVNRRACNTDIEADTPTEALKIWFRRRRGVGAPVDTVKLYGISEGIPISERSPTGFGYGPNCLKFDPELRAYVRACIAMGRLESVRGLTKEN